MSADSYRYEWRASWSIRGATRGTGYRVVTGTGSTQDAAIEDLRGEVDLLVENGNLEAELRGQVVFELDRKWMR